MRARLSIDWTQCDGRGLCAEMLPEVIEADEWGYPLFRNNGEVPFELEKQARATVELCPLLALRLQVPAAAESARR